ncbi:MAG: class I SAM-dependent methyltransferase [Actinobacteria bacterium]|nr:class I SAM-dependent methyltransferase [Actinomycetota bacterium]
MSRDVPGPAGAWFNPLAEFLGPAYLRNAFTKGTEQEVDFLTESLGLAAGTRVLDVGCGPGRHALALARRGIEVHGVDLSPDFVALATAAAAAEGLPARFDVLDVRDLAADGEFDAVICLCQGGFGLLGGRDEVGVFGRIAAAVRPGGGLAVSAFHAPFAVRHLETGESFDPGTGVLHEVATLRNEAGEEQPFDLWTTCFTTRELALLATVHGVEVVAIRGVAPGRYGATPPTLDDPELLLVGRRT